MKEDYDLSVICSFFGKYFQKDPIFTDLVKPVKVMYDHINFNNSMAGLLIS